MKKRTFFFLITLLVIAVLMAACGKSSEIICGNCAAKVPSDSQFCPDCGTAFFQNTTGATTEATTESTEATTADDTNTESTTQTTETEPPKKEAPAPTQPTQAAPPVNTHTHSYSAATCTTPKTCSCGATSGSALGHSYTKKVTQATCTTQGYTTYTCKCGHSYKDNYVSAAHSYHNYVCTSCGSVDKTHAYEYLCIWLYQNGTKEDNLFRLDNMQGTTLFSLVYDAKNAYPYICMSFESAGEFFFSGIWLDDYSYGVSLEDTTAEGYLNPSTFTQNSVLPVSSYSGNQSSKAEFVEVARLSMCDLLGWFEWYLAENDVGITIADLGFTAF